MMQNKSHYDMASDSKCVRYHTKHVTKKTNMNNEKINAKYGFALEPAVSLIILDTNV